MRGENRILPHDIHIGRKREGKTTMRGFIMAGIGTLLMTGSRSEGTLHLFFTPRSPDTAAVVWKARDHVAHNPRLKVHPILLVEDFTRTGTAEFGDGFLETVRLLQEWLGRDFSLPVFDEEGLRLAGRFALRAVPALVVERPDGIHILYGAGSLTCRSRP